MYSVKGMIEEDHWRQPDLNQPLWQEHSIGMEETAEMCTMEINALSE